MANEYLSLVNGVPRSEAFAGLSSIYDQRVVLVASSPTGNELIGPIAASTPITLPNSQTFYGLELNVYLNGDRLESTYDYSYVGSSPYTQIEFSFGLVVGDQIDFVINLPLGVSAAPGPISTTVLSVTSAIDFINSSYTGVLNWTPTANYTISMPNASGTALVSGFITGAINVSSLGVATLIATSNSTLTTLSALSLPGSQITGNISGNAANITATSNSTLTTISSLSLPTSQLSGKVSLTTQVSGTLPIANGGTNATSVSGARTNLGIDSGMVVPTGTTWTSPSTITTSTVFKITLVGGGGGGGGINTASAAGSGGGGGAAVILYAQGLSPSTSYTIQVGAAGAGGISTTTAATSGTASTISLDSITYTAGGGQLGADTVSTAGGAGGTATNTFGTGFSISGVNVPGQNGMGSSLANADAFYGAGGNSGLGFGHGGPPFTTSTGGTGNAGQGYGGGGSGGRGATATGGAGTVGFIMIEYWN